ncbi:hypothetical protein [Oceanobacillus sp. FSL K6-0251]|uniref:hypothetical protein n=1 Tax=Oceanobacillus sp. FSL K6-0251 TaxID=2921602 RepID=UPI0030FAF25E
MSKASYRNVRKGKFTQINNSLLWNQELSLQAKGLLSIFLSNSETFEINMKEIITRSKNGRDAHYKAITELINYGYFARVEVRDSDKHWFENIEYIFSDDKEDVENEIINIKNWASEENKKILIEYKGESDKKKKVKKEKKTPYTENPYTGNEDTENPNTENQYINNTKGNNTNLNNTKGNNTNSFETEEEEKINNIPPSSKNEIDQEQMILLIDKLNQKGWGENKIKAIIKRLIEKGIYQFTTKEIDRQVDYMSKEMGKEEVNFHTDKGFAKYFVCGIEKLINQSQIVSIYQREQMIEQQLKEERSKERKSLYYNWLEEA